jgi:hypothetical protein
MCFVSYVVWQGNRVNIVARNSYLGSVGLCSLRGAMSELDGPIIYLSSTLLHMTTVERWWGEGFLVFGAPPTDKTWRPDNKTVSRNTGLGLCGVFLVLGLESKYKHVCCAFE